MGVDDLTGRRWNIGDIVYKLEENYSPPYNDFEIKVVITDEVIMPKYGRGEEYGYFYDVLEISNNAPKQSIRGVTIGNNLRKNPKLGKKFWK